MDNNFWGKISKEHDEIQALGSKPVDFPQNSFSDDYSIINLIKNFNNYNRNDIQKFIVNYFTDIVHYKEDEFIDGILIPSIKRFGNLFADCSKYISSTINKYDIIYLTKVISKNIDKLRNNKISDENIFNIVLCYNRNLAEKILSSIRCDISNDDISRLIMNKYSTEEDMDSIVRSIMFVNNIICDHRPMMDVRDIISLYHVLYDHMTDVLVGVMHDVDINIRSKDSEYQEMYGRCTLALLDYLEMQRYDVILKSMENYVQIHYEHYAQYPVRFNILTISRSDYPRILNAYYQLQQMNIIVP